MALTKAREKMPFWQPSNLVLLTVIVGPSNSVKTFHEKEPCRPMSRATESRTVMTVALPNPAMKAPINAAVAFSK